MFCTKINKDVCYPNLRLMTVQALSVKILSEKKFSLALVD